MGGKGRDGLPGKSSRAVGCGGGAWGGNNGGKAPSPCFLLPPKNRSGTAAGLGLDPALSAPPCSSCVTGADVGLQKNGVQKLVGICTPKCCACTARSPHLTPVPQPGNVPAVGTSFGAARPHGLGLFTPEPTPAPLNTPCTRLPPSSPCIPPFPFPISFHWEGCGRAAASSPRSGLVSIL